MKTAIQIALLTVLSAVTALPADPKPTTYPTMMKFCNQGDKGDCTAPVSIYDKKSFHIPKGYKYASPVAGPKGHDHFFTLFRSEKGKIVACDSLQTDVVWEIVNEPATNVDGTSTFTILPGMIDEKDGVKCPYL